jgi:hypothetical protein
MVPVAEVNTLSNGETETQTMFVVNFFFMTRSHKKKTTHTHTEDASGKSLEKIPRAPPQLGSVFKKKTKTEHTPRRRERQDPWKKPKVPLPLGSALPFEIPPSSRRTPEK